MRTCGNDFVAEYLEKQQQMLQAAKMAQGKCVFSIIGWVTYVFIVVPWILT